MYSTAQKAVGQGSPQCSDNALLLYRRGVTGSDTGLIPTQLAKSDGQVCVSQTLVLKTLFY